MQKMIYDNERLYVNDSGDNFFIFDKIRHSDRLICKEDMKL